jgi:hypothetical protein
MVNVKEIINMKKIHILTVLLVGFATLLSGCRSLDPTPQETTASLYKYLAYANHQQIGDMIVAEGTEKAPASITITGVKVKVSTLLPPIDPPKDSTQKAEIVKSITDTTKTLGLAGAAAYLLHGANGDTSTTTTNNYATPAP